MEYDTEPSAKRNLWSIARPSNQCRSLFSPASRKLTLDRYALYFHLSLERRKSQPVIFHEIFLFASVASCQVYCDVADTIYWRSSRKTKSNLV